MKRIIVCLLCLLLLCGCASKLPENKIEKPTVVTTIFPLYDFAKACETGRVFHATVNGKSIRMFAFHYVYGFTYDQSNYLIGYDLTNKVIGAIPLCLIRDSYLVERKYKPSEKLIEQLQEYYENEEYSFNSPRMYSVVVCPVIIVSDSSISSNTAFCFVEGLNHITSSKTCNSASEKYT